MDQQTPPKGPARAVMTTTVPRPPRLLVVGYVCAAVVAFGLYGFALWTNRYDPGRLNTLIVELRNILNGVG